MSKIRGKNTKLEVRVRKMVWQLGYRYRLHRQDLPGKPDLVFQARRKIIFVHGCYWHRHDCPAGQQIPKTRIEFWGPKLARNAERDREVQEALRSGGWDILIVWECQLKTVGYVESAIKQFLGPASIKNFHEWKGRHGSENIGY